MIYIYFNDKNGTIYSADKQRCFSVVFGDDVYAFLRSEKNKEKRFYRTQTEETGERRKKKAVCQRLHEKQGIHYSPFG